MNCPNCGKPVEDPWGHCPACGAALDAKPGGKIGKSQKISKAFIYAPVECADNRYDDQFLSEIGDELHKFIQEGSPYPFQKP